MAVWQDAEQQAIVAMGLELLLQLDHPMPDNPKPPPEAKRCKVKHLAGEVNGAAASKWLLGGPRWGTPPEAGRSGRVWERRTRREWGGRPPVAFEEGREARGGMALAEGP